MFNTNHYYVEYLEKIIILCLISGNLSATISTLLESPCPNSFQYQYDETGMLYGIIQINSPQGNQVELNLEMSIGNKLEGYNGNIELAHSKEKVIEDIMHRRPITYKVYFPLWTNIPPKITKISVNGDLICSGPKISVGLVSIVTTVNLQHTLRIDVQPLISSANNFVPPATTSGGGVIVKASLPSPSDINVIRPDGGDSTDNKFTENSKRTPSRNFGNNPYNFNPTPTKKVPGVSFNPQTPKDSGNIFNSNPFLKTLTSTSSPGSDDVIENNSDNGRPNSFTNIKPTQRPISSKRTNAPQQSGNKNINRNTTPFSIKLPLENIDLVSKDKLPSDEPYEDICGRTVATNSLVINGNAVPRGAYPWLAAMFGVKATGLNYMCSGSLISDRHVVTAAHCVKTETKKLRPQELLIILGKLNIQKWVPVNGEKMIEPESIHIHPDYETMSSDADIAVLVLSEAVQFTKYIRPLCLWTGSSDLHSVLGKAGTVVGWGKDENGDLMTAEPRQTDLPIVSQEQCLRSSYQFQYITSNRTFCAGFRNGSGPCNGDSGGGFLMKKDGRWMLKGIVSMSISEAHTRTCDLKNYVVFTDASKFMDWLLSFIK